MTAPRSRERCRERRRGPDAGIGLGTHRQGAPAAAVAALATAALLVGSDAALATTDTTFDAPLDTVTDMLSGTVGQLAASVGVR